MGTVGTGIGARDVLGATAKGGGRRGTRGGETPRVEDDQGTLVGSEAIINGRLCGAGNRGCSTARSS